MIRYAKPMCERKILMNKLPDRKKKNKSKLHMHQYKYQFVNVS